MAPPDISFEFANSESRRSRNGLSAKKTFRISPVLGKILRRYAERLGEQFKRCFSTEENILGEMHSSVLPRDVRLPARKKIDIDRLGWHLFWYTYRSWLDETGAPMKVQHEWMRHASIQTTMNVYGQAMTSSKREANGKVVEMVLKSVAASA